jgi:hypothetical protein
MKLIIQIAVFTALVIAVFVPKLQAQTQPQHYDVVAKSPDADADIQVVIDYFNALVTGDLATAKSFMAENNLDYEPNAAQKELLAWAENYKTQDNRKIDFFTPYYKLTAGNLPEIWVSISAIYSCSIDDINIAIPVQINSLVENGKIKKQLIYFDNFTSNSQQGVALNPPKK